MAKKKNKLMEWQLWFHYFLLALGLILLLLPTGDVINQLIQFGIGYEVSLGWLALIMFYFIGLAIIDQIIHAVLKATTGWED